MVRFPKVNWQVLAVCAALTPPTFSFAQQEVTWAEDVMPIFQVKCQDCHRPDSIAPMSLLTYEQVRPFAPIIKYRVENRVMPPWHDNTENNPYNPDPTQWVGWGDRTVDEMAHNWVDVTFLGQEDYETMLADRNARLALRQGDSE